MSAISAADTPIRSPRSAKSITLTKLRRDLEQCSRKVEHLEREAEVHMKRMAAMQAEIDHLRSMIRS
jgi:hypothetical protein